MQQERNHAWRWKPSQFLGLVRSWLLEENPTVTLLDKHNPNQILHITLMPTYNCSLHTSSKEPLFTANGDHHRKPQQDRRQGTGVCGEPSSHGYIYAIVPASTAQETTEKRGWKGCNSRNTRKPAVNVSPRNGCKNKIGTIAMSKDALVLKGNLQGSHP